ncbi:unnamed protein product [Lymnaea stagnalis]|uniref:Bromo domain-containing protein n=1 Tax=Lymnaea stagnalis TaxID=6523 RepID=A0AAV2HMP2_LYMST
MHESVQQELESTLTSVSFQSGSDVTLAGSISITSESDLLESSSKIESIKQVSDSTLVSTESIQQASDSTLMNTESIQQASDSAFISTESIQQSSDSTLMSTESIQQASDSTLISTESIQQAPDCTLMSTESTQQPPDSTLMSTESTQQPSDSTLMSTESTQQPSDSTLISTESIQQASDSTLISTESIQQASDSTLISTDSIQQVTELVLMSTNSAQQALDSKFAYDDPIQLAEFSSDITDSVQHAPGSTLKTSDSNDHTSDLASVTESATPANDAVLSPVEPINPNAPRLHSNMSDIDKDGEMKDVDKDGEMKDIDKDGEMKDIDKDGEMKSQTDPQSLVEGCDATTEERTTETTDSHVDGFIPIGDLILSSISDTVGNQSQTSLDVERSENETSESLNDMLELTTNAMSCPDSAGMAHTFEEPIIDITFLNQDTVVEKESDAMETSLMNPDEVSEEKILEAGVKTEAFMEVKEEVKNEDKTDVPLEETAEGEYEKKVKDDYPVKHMPLYSDEKPMRGGLSRWQLVCDSVEDWANLTEQFKNTTINKEKMLYKIIKNDFLPEIPTIMEDKERAREKRAREMLPRRSSYRLELKKMEDEEKERLNKEAEEEEERQRALLEEERRQQLRIEEEKRHKEEKERARAERANRARLREERARLIAEGKEIPAELMNGLRQDENEDDAHDELQRNLEKVLLTIKRNDHSWPFLEAVEEVNSPDFFEMIKEPIDLLQIEKKLSDRGYKKPEEFERDMNLVFDNCIEYHGKDSDFGYMAENLKGVFERSMRRTFRVYLEPSHRPIRRKEFWGESSYVTEYGFAGMRSRKRGRKNSDSDSDPEPYMTGRVLYPSGRKWGADEHESEKKEPLKADDNDEDTALTPRATWSYRRELLGQDAGDFESYIPKTKKKKSGELDEVISSKRIPVDFSKYPGAKFRYSAPVKDSSRSLPRLNIIEYVKKEKPAALPGTNKVPPPGLPSLSGAPTVKANPVKVVKISREEYEKLLAENKITIVDANSPAGQVIKLKAGLQLKETNPAPKPPAPPTAPAQVPPVQANAETNVSDVPLNTSATVSTTPMKSPPSQSKTKEVPRKADQTLDIKERLRKVNEKIALRNTLRQANEKLANKLKNTISREESLVQSKNNPLGQNDKSEANANDFNSEEEKNPAKYTKILSKHELGKSKHHSSDQTPPVKKVRFSDELEPTAPKSDQPLLAKEGNESSLRLQEGPMPSKLQPTSSSSAERKKSPSHLSSPNFSSPQKSLEAESQQSPSIYEKWKRRAQKTLEKLSQDDEEPTHKRHREMESLREAKLSALDEPRNKRMKTKTDDHSDETISKHCNSLKESDSEFSEPDSVVHEHLTSITLLEPAHEQNKENGTCIQPSSVGAAAGGESHPFYKAPELQQDPAGDSCHSLEPSCSNKLASSSLEQPSSSAQSPTKILVELSKPAKQPCAVSLPSTSFAHLNPTTALKLSGLTSQLAQAMAQKKKKAVQDEGRFENCDSPRALSPPLLEPIEPIGEAVSSRELRDSTPEDDEMPVLVPDHLPPSLVEPGSDNIFQRMMSPEKSKM